MSTFETVTECAKRVFGDAAEKTGEQALVVTGEGDLSFTLFSDSPDGRDVYFRAKVAPLEGVADPGALCEEALQGNFFWQGTQGATLSLNDTEQALYLTDRRDATDLDEDEALRDFAEGFVQRVVLWRGRRDDHVPALARARKEVL